MIITEVRTAHVPVEIFGFQVKGEHVGENGVHGAGNVFGGRTCEISRCCQWSVASLPKLCNFCRTISTHIIFPLCGFVFVWFGARWAIFPERAFCDGAFHCLLMLRFQLVGSDENNAPSPSARVG